MRNLIIAIFCLVTSAAIAGSKLEWRQHQYCKSHVYSSWESYVSQRTFETTLKRRMQSYTIQMVLMRPGPSKPARHLIAGRVIERFRVPCEYRSQVRRLVKEQLLEIGIIVK